MAGLQSFYAAHSPGGSGFDTQAYAACVVDEGYDTFSPATRTALADGRIDTLPYDQLDDFTAVAGTCMSAQG